MARLAALQSSCFTLARFWADVPNSCLLPDLSRAIFDNLLCRGVTVRICCIVLFFVYRWCSSCVLHSYLFPKSVQFLFSHTCLYLTGSSPPLPCPFVVWSRSCLPLSSRTNFSFCCLVCLYLNNLFNLSLLGSLQLGPPCHQTITHVFFCLIQM